MTIPKEYRTPLRSRQDMVDYIFSVTSQRAYHSRNPFCFNVKLYRLNLEFNHLLKNFQESGNGVEIHQKSDQWLKAANELYEETGTDTLYQAGVDSASESFIEREHCLVNGTPVKADFTFVGRSAGWLSLNSFQGENFDCPKDELRNYMEGKYPEEKMNFSTLSQLYRFVVQMNVETKNAAQEVEFHAAHFFFEQLCRDIPEPDRIQLKLKLAV